MELPDAGHAPQEPRRRGRAVVAGSWTQGGRHEDGDFTGIRVQPSTVGGSGRRDVDANVGRRASTVSRAGSQHMYRERLWTMRQYIGFGTPHETNARFKYLMLMDRMH